MKKHLLALTALLALSQTTLLAQTNWTGAVDSALDTPGNWDNGLPSSSNLGIIGTGDTAQTTSAVTYSGYYIDLQTGGQITGTGTNSGILSGGEFTVNGGTINAFRGINAAGGQLITLNTGTWNLSDSDVVLSDSGTTVTINGGTVNDGNTKGFFMGSGTVLNINDGAIGTSSERLGKIGGNSVFGSGSGTVNFNGGDTYFTSLGGGWNSDIMLYNIAGASSMRRG